MDTLTFKQTVESKKLTRKEVAENSVIILGIALSVIKQSGIQSPLTIQEIKDQIVELRETFKLIEK
jgi:hypothetical protein